MFILYRNLGIIRNGLVVILMKQQNSGDIVYRRYDIGGLSETVASRLAAAGIGSAERESRESGFKPGRVKAYRIGEVILIIGRGLKKSSDGDEFAVQGQNLGSGRRFDPSI